MAGMRVSLSGLFEEIGRRAPTYKLILQEVDQHIRGVISGEHTIEEFADHYCLSDSLPPKTASTPTSAE